MKLKEFVIKNGIFKGWKRKSPLAHNLALTDVENLMLQLLNSLEEGIHGVDLNGNILFENTSANQLLGYSHNENIGKNSHELMHHHRLDGSIYPKEQCPLYKTIHDATPRRSQIETLWCKDGSPLPVEMSSSPIFNENQAVVGAVLLFRDFRAQQIAEEKSKKSDSLIAMAGRIVKLGGWTIDLETKKVIWSKELLVIHEMPLGWTPSSLQEEQDFCLPEYQNLMMKSYTACIEDGIPFDIEIQIITGQGRKIWVRNIGEPVRDSFGKVVRVQGARQDIEDRKRLEQQLIRSQRLESLGTLAGGIAHDLNNILTPAMLAVDLLQKSNLENHIQKIVSTIQTSIERGAALVKQVLLFARGSEGQRVVLEVPELLQEIEKIANETFLKNIEIKVKWDSDLWKVQGNSTQLHQILLNIAVNARDAMPNGGQLVISAKNIKIEKSITSENNMEIGSYVLISIQDSGFGIPKDQIDKIFDPFFTTKEFGRGTGLGLSTSLGIAKSHNGFLQVESELGHGTIFKLYLPAQFELKQVSVKKVPSSIKQNHGQGILVIDDEDFIREITKLTLESFGFRVFTCADGESAISIFSQYKNEIDLILTDLMMPKMDGVKTIQRLLEILPNIKIIVTSGLNSDENILKAQKAGASAFISKPFSAETLLLKISEVMNYSKSV